MSECRHLPLPRAARTWRILQTRSVDCDDYIKYVWNSIRPASARWKFAIIRVRCDRERLFFQFISLIRNCKLHLNGVHLGHDINVILKRFGLRPFFSSSSFISTTITQHRSNKSVNHLKSFTYVWLRSNWLDLTSCLAGFETILGNLNVDDSGKPILTVETTCNLLLLLLVSSFATNKKAQKTSSMANSLSISQTERLAMGQWIWI